MTDQHLGYRDNGFLGRDFSGDLLYYQKFKNFGCWIVLVKVMDSGETLDTIDFRGPEPTMSELKDVVRGYARALGALSYV